MDPVEEQFSLKMNVVKSALDDVFNGINKENRKVGFILLVYDNQKTERVNFVSNGAGPNDVLQLLKKQVELLEEQLG